MEVDEADDLTFFASFATIGINYVLRYLIMKVFVTTGCNTYSQEMKYITVAIFFAQFFNTGILLMLVNANMAGQGWPLSSIFRGIDPDFNSRWFANVGDTLVNSMFINIYMPAFECFYNYCIRLLKRAWDKRFWTKRTSCKTRQAYIELYSGPTFYMHYKYSMILNITFVTMTFGVGMPVLFPIATLSFLFLYFVEKGMLYYGYREPPQYDEVLNNTVLDILKYAPLFLLGFGFWMLSSN